MPLPPVIQRLPDDGGRQPPVDLTAAAGAPQAGVVQRVILGPEGEEKAEGGLDLDRLARQVYPLIKRMMAVERERRTGRWG